MWSFAFLSYTSKLPFIFFQGGHFWYFFKYFWLDYRCAVEQYLLYPFVIYRNEVVSLFQSFGRFSSAIKEVDEFRRLLSWLGLKLFPWKFIIYLFIYFLFFFSFVEAEQRILMFVYMLFRVLVIILWILGFCVTFVSFMLKRCK